MSALRVYIKNQSKRCIACSAMAKHANCNTTAPHLVSRGAFWYRVECILAQVGCIFRGRGASQNYLDYSAIWSDYYSKIRAWRFYG